MVADGFLLGHSRLEQAGGCGDPKKKHIKIWFPAAANRFVPGFTTRQASAAANVIGPLVLSRASPIGRPAPPL